MGCGSSLKIQAEGTSPVTTDSDGYRSSPNHLHGDRITMLAARNRRESKCAQQHRRASMLAPIEVERVRERRKSSCFSLSAQNSPDVLLSRSRAQTWNGSSNTETDLNNNETPGYYNSIVIDVQDYPTNKEHRNIGTPAPNGRTDEASLKSKGPRLLITDFEEKKDGRSIDEEAYLEENAAYVVNQAVAKAVKISAEAY